MQLTDPQSRIMPGANGMTQGYNAHGRKSFLKNRHHVS